MTIRQVLDWMIGFIDRFNTHHSELQAITALPLIYTLYSSLLQTLVFSSYYYLYYPFPGNGF
jgi:hypothetical protein